MAGISDKDATDAIAKAKKDLEAARALLNSMTVEMGYARETYTTAYTNYKDKYDSFTLTGSTLKGVDEFAKAAKDASDDMEKKYQAWLKNMGDDTLKSEYLDARKAYDQANYQLIIAQTSVRKVDALTDVEVTKLSDAVDAYTKAYTDYLKADPDADPVVYKDLEDKYKAAKTALDKLQTDLTKVEDKSPEGLLNTAKQAAAAAEAKVKAAEVTVSNAEKTLATAQQSATSTEIKNASADDTLASLTNYKIQTDGTIVGTSDAGVTITIGKIALAGVQNNGGLEKDSGYYYNIGANAGNVSVYEGGGTEGRILGNYLEQAKVDLATEMTEMITTQRGFQANSKIITVTDQMLDELVNMKR